MKVFVFLILILTLPSALIAKGGEGVGGGDPMAVEFLVLAVKFRTYTQKQLGYIPSRYIARIVATEKRWRWSLSRNEQPSLVVFVEERPVDQHGTPKAAVYDRATSEVRIHRPTWSAMDKVMKLQLVAMELLGIAGVDRDRYFMALIAVQEDASIILYDTPARLL